jgi:hypothetical protein
MYTKYLSFGFTNIDIVGRRISDISGYLRDQLIDEVRTSYLAFQVDEATDVKMNIELLCWKMIQRRIFFFKTY